MSLKNKFKLSSIALASAVAMGTLATPTTASAEVAYNVGVVSKYLLRGIFEENKGTAVQGGVDWNNSDGWYAGWWFSSLGYEYEATSDNKTNQRGFENDLYGGYSGSLGKGISYEVGLLQYVYANVANSNLLEATGKLSLGDFYVGAQYLLSDGWWGNAGDIYWKAGWSTTVASDVGLALDYGYYTYNDSDNSKLGSATTSTSGFRHLNLTASKPIGKTGANAYVQYTFAGEDRTGKKYNNSMVAGITYGF